MAGWCWESGDRDHYLFMVLLLNYDDSSFAEVYLYVLQINDIE